MSVMAPDMQRQEASFFERGWVLTDLPSREVVLEARAALEERLRELVGSPSVTLDTYHEYATDETHDNLQWEMTTLFRERGYARKILQTHSEFLRRMIGLDLHIQARPYLRVARPGRATDNVGYHRDNDYGCTPYEVSCHVPLTDVDAKGCLRVLDGSHVMPGDAFPKIIKDTGVVRKSKKHDMGFVYRTKNLPSVLGERMTRVPMRVGQLLMFSLSLAHGQEVNESTRSRVSFDTRLVNSLAPIKWDSDSNRHYEEFAQSGVLRQARLFFENSRKSKAS